MLCKKGVSRFYLIVLPEINLLILFCKKNFNLQYYSSRISWDTSVKHYIRNGLYSNLPEDLKNRISKTNKHRWQRETSEKYMGCDVVHFIKEELELLKRTDESRNAKKVMEAYFKLSDTYHEIISTVKGIKRQIAS
jgi:hypothetical protein